MATATRRLKVFRMNDYEWWMATTLDEAKRLCMEYCELPEDEACDDPCELTEAEMQRLKYSDDDGRTVRTFAEQLARKIAGGAGPGPFAFSEG
jgi:hypothetical protein